MNFEVFVSEGPFETGVHEERNRTSELLVQAGVQLKGAERHLKTTKVSGSEAGMRSQRKEAIQREDDDKWHNSCVEVCAPLS